MSNLVIILGGPGGSGRSTLAQQLSKALNLRTVSGGMIHRQIALELGFGVKDETTGQLKPSETKLVQYFREYVPSHTEIDLDIDAKLLKEAHQGNVVIESWTLAPLTKRLSLDYLRIWITAAEEERARRICEREKQRGNVFSTNEMMKITKFRLEINRKRYQALYGFDFLDLDKYYEFVFDTTHLQLNQMGQILISQLKKKGWLN